MRDMSQEIVEQFWTDELGAGAGFVATAPQVGCAVQQLYAGVQLFRRDRRLIVAVPPDRVELFQQAIQERSVEEMFASGWLQAVLGDDAETVLGPALVNYSDQLSFRPTTEGSARAMTEADGAAYAALVAALSAEEIAASGLSAQGFPAFGVFSEDKLCTVASYSIWQPAIAHIVVATHPSYRRRGFARAAVSALAVDAFARGLILQWRALTSNQHSLALARSLGFTPYCETLFARLRDA